MKPINHVSLLMKLMTSFVFIPISLLSIPVGALDWKGVKVPPLALLGSSSSLCCRFALEKGETLYSVVWYRAGKQVLRVSLGGRAVFPQPGLRIDRTASNGTCLVLSPITLAATGRYRCEVTTEAPKFSSRSGWGDLLVIKLPAKSPTIRRKMSPSTLHLSCTSPPSLPAPDLSWNLQGQFANSSYSVVTQSNGLLVSSSSFTLPLSSSSLSTPSSSSAPSSLTVSCTASIGSIYAQTTTQSFLTTI